MERSRWVVSGWVRGKMEFWGLANDDLSSRVLCHAQEDGLPVVLARAHESMASAGVGLAF